MHAVLPKSVVIRIISDEDADLSAMHMIDIGVSTRLSILRYMLHQATLGRELLGWKDAFAVVSKSCP